MTQDIISKPIKTSDASIVQAIRWNINDTLVMTWRNLIHYIRLPQLIVFSSVQPILLLLLFYYVFGGAVQTTESDYINYLLPGLMVQVVLFGGTQTAVGLSEDLTKGMIDRFRSLPMARSAVLAGRTLADTVRNVFVTLLMIGVGYILGFRIQGGFFGATGAILLIVLFGYTFSWVSALIGMYTRDPETSQVAGFIWVFPMVFASSTFVPTTTMPKALRYFAENQPVTETVNTARSLILGEPAPDWWKAVAWMIVICAVFIPLAINRYRQVT